ncbi:MAG: hypothetical protein LC104_07175 [Bacteroidales bacterium]|nr:hypothetical protein [Bacteroidales bacterium]
MTAHARILEYLTRRIGLDPDSLGASTIAEAIQERMRIVEKPEPNSYREYLETEPAELQKLAERIVVSETWFFRGPGLFDYLARTIRDAVHADPKRIVRVLSIPCSTGEEPYSLAMALQELQVPPNRHVLVGVDLSTQAITTAQRGVYREFAFRQILPAIRARYFRNQETTWTISDAIKSRVQFHTGNLLDPHGISNLGSPFDIVLCRNLLIYFTAETRRQALNQIERLLLPEGLLAVGSAEPSALSGRPFLTVGTGELFLFRYSPSTQPSGVPPRFSEPRRSQGSVILAPVLPRQVTPVAVPLPTPRTAPIPVVGNPVTEPSLDEARLLADAGQLSAAETLCQAVLARTPTAQGYALLGVICHARGRLEEATEALRRALYLEPHHREALIHALTVALAAGQTAQAENLRARLRKLTQEERP